MTEQEKQQAEKLCKYLSMRFRETKFEIRNRDELLAAIVYVAGLD